MSNSSGAWFYEVLACPDCGGQVQFAQQRVTCASCGYTSGADEDPLDLRPQNPRAASITFSRLLKASNTDELQNIVIGAPEITYKGPQAWRDSRELISEIECYLQVESNVLDLGCGPRDQVVPIEHIGHQYVGVDYSNPKADFLADAHALPFADDSFDCVLSYAVLEHLHTPAVAVREIARVLKPGGVYVGTVSLGEPFHDSYFHHTAWGIISLVSTVPGMQIKRLWPSGDTLGSLSRMGRYPRVIRSLLGFVHRVHEKLPWLAPRKLRWSEQEKMLDRLHRAGSICFTIQLENAD